MNEKELYGYLVREDRYDASRQARINFFGTVLPFAEVPSLEN